MKKILEVNVTEPVIGLATEVEYGHRWDWCSSRYTPLKLSLLRPRRHFYYDPLKEVYPLLVFFCGGGWTEMDRSVWMPELTWFAKHGYAVASVEYSVTARTRFPMQAEDGKAAIRYLRAHAGELGVNADRIVVMGESAGGYMSGLIALSGQRTEWDVGDYPEQSSAVQGAVCYYPGVDMAKALGATSAGPRDPAMDFLPRDIGVYPALQELVTPDTPPMMILQGDADTQVHYTQAELLWQALEAKGVRNEYYLIPGAEHADAHFVQEEVKQIILKFADSICRETTDPGKS